MSDTLSAIADRAERAQTCSELCEVFREAINEALFRQGGAKEDALRMTVARTRSSDTPALLLGVAAALMPSGWMVLSGAEDAGETCFALAIRKCDVSEDGEYAEENAITQYAKTEPGARLSAALRARAQQQESGNG